MKKCLVIIILFLTGCVNADPITGKTLPRGGQKYEFATVEKQAEYLKIGMTKYDVLMLLGAPARVSDDEGIWEYLPERPAILIPARALRLVFINNALAAHSYRAVVLGQPL